MKTVRGNPKDEEQNWDGTLKIEVYSDFHLPFNYDELKLIFEAIEGYQTYVELNPNDNIEKIKQKIQNFIKPPSNP